MVITGCPVSTSVPFADKSTADKFDKTLLGTWKNDESEVEANEVNITKGKAANTYKIKITKPGSTFESKSKLFTGWITTVKDTRFLVLQAELNPKEGDVYYYLYTIESNEENLVTHFVAFEVGDGKKADSIDEFQKHILESRNREDFLSGKVEWSKR